MSDLDKLPNSSQGKSFETSGTDPHPGSLDAADTSVRATEPPQVLIVGAGMIVHDQILPSLYHLQRQGRIAGISICATSHETVRRLAEAESLSQAFPGHSFRMYPAAPAPSPQPAL